MRLDGWKSIAAYFNRERTTVIRWSTERGMPVHRIPGSRRGSVYALTEELDAWLETSREQGLREEDSDTTQPPVPTDVPLAASGRKWWRIGGGALAMAAAFGVAAYAWPDPKAEPRLQVPQSEEAAAFYVEARSDWARRTPVSILSAIEKLQHVVAIEPGFAPAYSALADSFLLAREFGSLTDLEAFSRAQLAVDAALKIDPAQASALRAKGFIEYWWRGDRIKAGRSFRRALAIDDKSAQTQFWFANTLIDNGEFREGLQRFVGAQLLEPASPAIAADLAWARWSVGETQEAKAALIALRRDNPSLATIPDYLSVIALAEGDIPTFVAEIETMAGLRKEEGLSAYATELRALLAESPSAVVAKVVSAAVTEADRGDRRTLAWPAFVASSAGDRAILLNVLRKAEARNEVWGSAGLLQHMRARWSDDAEIAALLRERKPNEFLSLPGAAAGQT